VPAGYTVTGGTKTTDGAYTVHTFTTVGNDALAISEIGSYASALTGLVKGTRYFVKAWATNSAGTSYGAEVVFETRDDYVPGGSRFAGATSGAVVKVGSQDFRVA
jgi:hypothetical protein